MAGEWREVTIGEIAAPVRNALVGGPFGSNLVSRDYVDAGVPIIRGQNMAGRWVAGEFAYVSDAKADSLDANLARPGDIVFTQRGTLGQVSIVPSGQFDRYLVSQSQMKLTVNRELADPLFIYYAFSSPEQQDYIRQNAIQTGVPHTNLGILRETLVLLPPLLEQRSIAHILGTLDDKIELNRRTNEMLEAMARALFKSWFVDFDPVRAKAEGRDPGLPQPLADLLPDSFVDSDIGRIPRGWGVRSIDELSEQVAMGPFGSSIKVETFVADGIPVISGQHLWGTLLDDSEYNFITEEHADQLKRSNIRRGDVVFTHAGSIGQVTYVPDTSRYERYVISQRQFYMRCNQRKMSPLFIVFYFKTAQGQHRLLANTSSTGVPSISQPVSYLRQLQIVVPPEDFLKTFDSFARTILRRVAANKNESASLGALRDSLLRKLTSRELRVKSTDKIV